ncbi:MAG: hypothetical protein CL760_05715 [Chloroflexi bacterium]|nr:hypothetical protein [Chloroflexota bacterium]|tara:strand:- start:19999 stop:20202 length:204 start_codon:yes stop_codon:yes gene_type:complete
MKHTEVNKDHLDMIIESLMVEYSTSEVLEMLNTAVFSVIDNGYNVTYENGVEDKFVFVQKLVHESDV